MCGIAGFFHKGSAGGPEADAPVGDRLLRMLRALAVRGPDSTGVALFNPESDRWLLRVKAGESTAAPELVDAILREAGRVAAVTDRRVEGASLRLALPGGLPAERAEAVVAALEGIPAPAPVEVVSLGRQLEIVKQVGSPDELEAVSPVSRFRGTLGIGHTRLSTESRVDLSHSQPFWAHGLPDVAVVHNGHITNYDRMRRRYEQRGVRFYTENDSEIIGIYLRDHVTRGDSLEEAMAASTRDFDGSFCYLVAAPGLLGVAKDRFGFKPLVVAETEEWVAVATEEVALREALGRDFPAREPAPGALRVWTRAVAAPAAAGA